ncbi:hypothetical protein GCM10010495_80580 [Kitasatospora herbaricolor]|uniref:DUF692 domain-containing protein n=1 Tax=Kitasatospora herbaricolor TaxID=68217 RepID=UPI00174AD09A|nr:DUF692 family multinuclear iron-containing protein [Kitasatospora herbaricolor]MDQ0308682.1 uncharacterized protein (UPF0276 family) [Kitasatospora herbaricolor]GGV50774.1 hypothetical protein GCM10010495_80580 [Kitasatospora herbaricolor]
MTRLGVGLTYVPGLDRITDACADLLDVVEVEPQTLWRSRTDGGITLDEEALRRIADLPGARLLHGVGNPVGGCRPPDRGHIALVGELAERLGAPWVSEHLAFNRVGGPGEGFRTGFMLPPCPTPGGSRRGIRSVRTMAAALPVPLAVEIGANYLRPRPGELSDGEFARRVAEGSGCGLLLDLHNVLANERNGRGGVDEVLAALPLERVWEVHLAGGTEYRGYWLDAHSGLPDEELTALAERILPRLPALRAVLFEVTPSAVPQLDPAAVRELLARMRAMWPDGAPLPPLRPLPPVLPGQSPRSPAGPSPGGAYGSYGGPADRVDPEEWEEALGGLAIGREPGNALARELAEDPAIGLIRDLVTEFRGSALAGSLRWTVRLLLLSVGGPGTRELLDGYVLACPPQLFATEEAFAFAAHLRRLRPRVRWLEDVLELDLGLIRAQIDGQPCTVRLGTDPTALMADLGAGRLPVDPPRGTFRVRLVDDSRPAAGAASGSVDPSAPALPG